MTGGDDSDPGGEDWKHLGLFRNDAALREMMDMESKWGVEERDAICWGYISSYVMMVLRLLWCVSEQPFRIVVVRCLECYHGFKI